MRLVLAGSFRFESISAWLRGVGGIFIADTNQILDRLLISIFHPGCQDDSATAILPQRFCHGRSPAAWRESRGRPVLEFSECVM